MNRNLRIGNDPDSDSSVPSETWLFAQAILGKPIPDPYAAARRAREQRAQLERLAQVSPRHANELRELERVEAEARRSRESLIWAAGIFTEAEAELHELLREEAKAQEAQRRWEQYYEDYLARITEWNPDQPRQPKGTPEGGQWAAKGGGGDSQSKPTSLSDRIRQRNSEIAELAGVASSKVFRVGKHSDMPTPRPGQHSHHGVMSAWLKQIYRDYDVKKAPAILMPETNHRATTGVFNTWRAEIARKQQGAFDWSKVTEAEMRALSEKMFDAAKVPSEVRRQYWQEFDRMKNALRESSGRPVTEGVHMSNPSGVLTADEMKQRYGSFYDRSPRVCLDRNKVPERFWRLLPYAEFWGIADDLTREILVEEASAEIQQNLKEVVSEFDRALDEWLAGPEANDPQPSAEYVAYSAMRMASDFV